MKPPSTVTWRNSSAFCKQSGKNDWMVWSCEHFSAWDWAFGELLCILVQNSTTKLPIVYEEKLFWVNTYIQGKKVWFYVFNCSRIKYLEAMLTDLLHNKVILIHNNHFGCIITGCCNVFTSSFGFSCCSPTTHCSVCKLWDGKKEMTVYRALGEEATGVTHHTG